MQMNVHNLIIPGDQLWIFAIRFIPNGATDGDVATHGCQVWIDPKSGNHHFCCYQYHFIPEVIQ